MDIQQAVATALTSASLAKDCCGSVICSGTQTPNEERLATALAHLANGLEAALAVCGVEIEARIMDETVVSVSPIWNAANPFAEAKQQQQNWPSDRPGEGIFYNLDVKFRDDAATIPNLFASTPNTGLLPHVTEGGLPELHPNGGSSVVDLL